MILAIDIGNTNLTIGCFDGEQICFAERLSTDLTRTEFRICSQYQNYTGTVWNQGKQDSGRNHLLGRANRLLR